MNPAFFLTKQRKSPILMKKTIFIRYKTIVTLFFLASTENTSFVLGLKTSTYIHRQLSFRCVISSTLTEDTVGFSCVIYSTLTEDSRIQLRNLQYTNRR